MTDLRMSFILQKGFECWRHNRKHPNAQNIKRQIAGQFKYFLEDQKHLKDGELDNARIFHLLGDRALKHIEPFTNLILNEE